MKKSISIILAILMCFSCFSIISFAETTESEYLTTVPEGYIGIYTKDDLDNVRKNLKGNYILMNDIEFSESDFEEGGSFYNNGYAWKPIGTDYTSFSGIFNGNGYKISGLLIMQNPSDENIGLFSTIVGKIHNLNVSASISATTAISIGIICGSSRGTISHCKSSGTLYAERTDNRDIYVGGICGSAYDGSINYCANSADINANVEYVPTPAYLRCGGIVGFANENIKSVSNCYNTGNINANVESAGSFVGGIVGAGITNYLPMVSNCYNAGTIYGHGLIEDINRGKIGGITGGGVQKIENCYNIGKIIADSFNDYGAITGSTTNQTNCYYLDSSCEYAVHAIFDSMYYNDPKLVITGNRMTSSEMKIEDSFEGYDFDNIWIVDADSDYPYPQLKDNLPVGSNPVRHTYSSTVTQEPNCTTMGMKKMTCDTCGFSLDVLMDMTEHSYFSTVTKAPTHTEEGIMTFTCICNLSYTEKINKTSEHSYSKKVTSPTCTAQGYTTYTCPCGDEHISDYTDIDPLAHRYSSEITTQPTHIKDGVKTFTCYLCKDTYTENIPKLGGNHSYKSVVTPPTCTEQGFTTYTCICGDSYVSNYIDATGHSHKYTVTTPATHTTTGVMTYTCTCGDTYTETIKKSEKHEHQANILSEATHTSEGLVEYICICGDTYTEAIAKTTEHSFTANIIEDASCTKEGTKLFTCECGESYTEAISKTKHINENDDYNCDICGKTVCSHMCHKSGFMGFIWKIIQFFWKIFGMNPICECGAYHY